MSNLEDLADLAVKPIWDGVIARMVHGDRITMAIVEIAPDGVVPENRHENEQVGVLIRGRLTFTVGEETRTLEPGGTWRIPSGVPHRVVAGEEGAVVVDIFSPPRADWQRLESEPARPPAWPPPREA